jgi:hypothetical protein
MIESVLANPPMKLTACGRRLRRNAQGELFILSAAAAGRSLWALRYANAPRISTASTTRVIVGRGVRLGIQGQARPRAPHTFRSHDAASHNRPFKLTARSMLSKDAIQGRRSLRAHRYANATPSQWQQRQRLMVSGGAHPGIEEQATRSAPLSAGLQDVASHNRPFKLAAFRPPPPAEPQWKPSIVPAAPQAAA